MIFDRAKRSGEICGLCAASVRSALPLEVILRSLGAPYLARFCARCGKPQISPLRFAPVEMTKLGVIANQAFLSRIFIPLESRFPSGMTEKKAKTDKSATPPAHSIL
jgi:hypothetical protein